MVDINVRKKSDVQLVHLRGDLRLGPPVNELRQTLEELVSSGDTHIVLKLADVPMIDSSGIGLLVKFLTNVKQRGGSLKLVKPTDFATKTLRVTGVLNLFEVYDDDEAAVASFEHAG